MLVALLAAANLLRALPADMPGREKRPAAGARCTPQLTAAGSMLAWQVSIALLLANFNMLATLESMDNIKLYYHATRVAATRCAAPHRVATRHVARPQNGQVAQLHGDAQHHHPLQHHGAQPQDEHRDLLRRARGHERARGAASATRRAASTLPR